MAIRRGDIYYADLRPIQGSEQGGVRPVLIIQNDKGNFFSPTVIAAAITSRPEKKQMPTHIPVRQYIRGLRSNSVILLEQVRTIDRARLRTYIGRLSSWAMREVDATIAVSLGLAGGVYEHGRMQGGGESEETGMDLLFH